MGKNDKAIKEAEKQLGTYADLINYQSVNELLTKTDIELKEISKKTITNIAKWALNGAENKEIAANLEITTQQFRTLCNICPVITYIMSQSRQMADIIVSGSLFERAIGGKKVMRQQAVKINVFDDCGNKVGEDIKVVDLYEELPPDPSLLKFLAQNKLSEQFGKAERNPDKEMDRIVETLSEEQLKIVNESLLNNKK